MVEPTTTRLTFTVDAETYRHAEDAQRTERAAFDRSTHALLNPADFGRVRRAELMRELAQARRELAYAYSDLVKDLGFAAPLTRSLAGVVSQLHDDADQDEQYAIDLERQEVSGDEERG